MTNKNNTDPIEINEILASLEPVERLKFLRQKIVKKSQSEFCADGIIRVGTLKAIESQKMKIADKIAYRLAHKMGLEGVVCNATLFLHKKSSGKITLKNLNAPNLATDCLEEIKNNVSNLIPIKITNNAFLPFISEGDYVLCHKIKREELTTLDKSLCLLITDSVLTCYITYQNGIFAIDTLEDTRKLAEDFFDLCTIYTVRVLYFAQS